MPAAPEITDRNRLNAWLDALPRNSPDEAAEAHRIVMSITFRATMRMLPVTLPILLSENARERGLTPEAIFRRLLSAGVTSICPTPETKEKAAILTDANAASTFAFASASVSDKTTALVGAYDSATTRRAAWRALDGDCQALADGNSLRLRPLWPDGNNPLEHAWQEAVSALTKAGPERAFWIDWYEKCLAGALQDWEGLLTDIALLPSEDWDKGPKHIAELIAQLQKKREGTPPKFAENTLRAIKTAVARNGPTLALQLDALAQLVETELERIRGKNPEDDLAQQEREHLIAVFTRMRGAIASMRALLPADGGLDDAGAQEMGGWAVVLAQAGEAWNSEAKRMLLKDPAGKVETAGRLVAAGSVAGVLTACGLPILGAIAGGVIIGEKKLTDLTKAVRGLGSGGT